MRSALCSGEKPGCGAERTEAGAGGLRRGTDLGEEKACRSGRGSAGALPLQHAENALSQTVQEVDQQEFAGDGRAAHAWETVERAGALQETLAGLEAERVRLTAMSESLQPWLEYDVPLSDCETAKTRTWLGSIPLAVPQETVNAATDRCRMRGRSG